MWEKLTYHTHTHHTQPLNVGVETLPHQDTG